MSISTKPPSGMRDFLADDIARREHVVAKIRAAYERHGFVPLETPTMERLQVLSGKYGDEGEQLMFKVLKRGRKLRISENATPADLTDLGLRYDLTVPLARVFARHRNDLPRFYKRYQIQPVWRADRPQHGRFREFYQCDVDYIGTTSTVAELEAISAVTDALQALSFDRFTVRINDRRVLTGMLETAGVPPDLQSAALVAIDKLDKIGVDGVVTELTEAGISEASVTRLRALVLDPAPEGESNADRRARLRELMADSVVGVEGIDALDELFTLIDEAGLYGDFAFDPTLARGLSYYTGPIFEIASDDFSGSLGGGGRYDGLIGMFLGTDVPAVGFSIGLERILVVMQERGMFDDLRTGADVVVTQLDAEARAACVALARSLRAAGVRAELYPDLDKLGKQFKHAESIGARYCTILGKREVENGVVAIKDLVTGDQTTVETVEAPAELASRF